MIALKRVYEPPSPSDGCRVLVDRLWPRGLARDAAHLDLWMKDVAPSDVLRQWYAHGPAKWPEFRRRHRAELKAKAALFKALHEREQKHGLLTLLFAAKDEQRNNAVVLAELLK